jgi:hypothetical protein
MMKRGISLGVLLAAGMIASPASADLIDASGVLTSTLDADGTNFDYSITLTNSAASTTGIGTFWFSWVPGKDFMTDSPISETSPAGWAAKVTHGASPDGFAIQWIADTPADAIPIGGSKVFAFKSPETPAQLAMNSLASPTNPQLTAVLYNGAPFSATSETIVVAQAQAVPEPSSLALALVGGVAVFAYKRIKR